MSKIIVIASGKGGVGKSFLASNLALSMQESGVKTLLVDGDLGGANIHNFLGAKVPKTGVYNLLREGAQIDDVITQSSTGINFIAGSGDVLGMANITAVERADFMNKLKHSGYPCVLLDLGAGTSFNTIDFFNMADERVLVVNSEPTSIENAYGLLKIAVYRHLERLLSNNTALQNINRRLRSKSLSYPDFDSIIFDVSAIDKNTASGILSLISNYRVGIVLNLVRFKKELNIFYGFEQIIKRYLRVSIEKLGFIPYDDKVSESVRLMLPFYTTYRESGTASCIDNMRSALMSEK